MPDFSFAAGNRPTAAQWNAWVRDQVETQCTSSTRPASPVAGRRIYEVDTNRAYKWNGAAWIFQGGEPIVTTLTLATGWTGLAKLIQHSEKLHELRVEVVRATGGTTTIVSSGIPNMEPTFGSVAVRDSGGVLRTTPNQILWSFTTIYLYVDCATGDLVESSFLRILA